MPNPDLRWRSVPGEADFTASAGPIEMAGETSDDGIRALRFRVEITAQHCNAMGVCHGGMIATFVDQAMGMAIVDRLPDPTRGASTISLSVDYLAGARPGDLLETAPVILRMGRSIGYCETRVQGPQGLVARASATFRLPSS